ncbi:MAG: amidase [Paracoccaceae bacterium]
MELLDRSACEITGDIAGGRLAPSDLMAATLDRIAAVNPTLNAIVALRDPDALMAEARAADDAVARGPLHGLPVAIKDFVAVRGVVSTMGSPLFATHVPETDDILAARLRAAGAIPIGKTNVPEFGLGSHSFNPVYGVTAIPDTTRTAGGSSGGAAVGLATRMLALADGSTRWAACAPGGRVQCRLAPALARACAAAAQGDLFLHPLSTDGPMARSPRDLALLLSVLARPDPRVPATRPVEDYARGLDAPVAGRRIGWLGGWGGAWRTEVGILDLCESALGVFEDLGCIVEPVLPPFSAAALWNSWTTLRAFAVAARLGEAYRTTPEALKPEAVWEVEKGLALTGQEIQAASLIRSEWYRRAAELFETHDALVLPTAQVWPFPADWRWPQEIAGVRMDTYHRWMEVVIPASLTGLPAVTLPAGFGEAGLPMGMQVIGPRGGDMALLQLAEAYHRATDWPSRRPPSL